MGGAVICNPRSPYYTELKEIVRVQHEELLWCEVWPGSSARRGRFPSGCGDTTGVACSWPSGCAGIRPSIGFGTRKWEFNEAYEAVRRPDGGYGALITFMPHNADKTSPASTTG